MAKTILVADDNPTLRKVLCKLFGVEKDIDLCVEAVDGAQAIALAKQCKPDLIILEMSQSRQSDLRGTKTRLRTWHNKPRPLIFACAQFCAHPGYDTIANGSKCHNREKPLVLRKLNVIANNHTQSQNRAPQLLTEGLLVRI
jgi:chemotaxis response regulator CheB